MSLGPQHLARMPPASLRVGLLFLCLWLLLLNHTLTSGRCWERVGGVRSLNWSSYL